LHFFKGIELVCAVLRFHEQSQFLNELLFLFQVFILLIFLLPNVLEFAITDQL
jgi:hypothetical protein